MWPRSPPQADALCSAIALSAIPDLFSLSIWKETVMSRRDPTLIVALLLILILTPSCGDWVDVSQCYGGRDLRLMTMQSMTSPELTCQARVTREYHERKQLELAEASRDKEIAALMPAARSGDASAQFHIGLIFEKYRQYSDAQQWYRAAAEYEYGPAELRLGALASSHDLSESLTWNERACRHGDGDGCKNAERIKAEIETNRQTAIAQAQAHRQQEKYNAILDKIVAEDSRAWAYNKYAENSMDEGTITSGAFGKGSYTLRGNFHYIAGGSGWVEAHFSGGALSCLRFWDFPNECRPQYDIAKIEAQRRQQAEIDRQAARQRQAAYDALPAAEKQRLRDQAAAAARRPRQSEGCSLPEVLAIPEILPPFFAGMALADCH
jgi:TPR repeat protein